MWPILQFNRFGVVCVGIVRRYDVAGAALTHAGLKRTEQPIAGGAEQQFEHLLQCPRSMPRLEAPVTRLIRRIPPRHRGPPG